MRTLKEKGISYIDIVELKFDYSKDNSLWVTIEDIKEWLTQKRQENKDNEFEVTDEVFSGREEVFDELLEELK
jgi:hypothetical protein